MQLTYRGNHYTPSHQVETSAPVEMTYRGVNYTRNSAPMPAYRQSQPINWRYQLSANGIVNLPKHPFSLPQ
jgi:Domain of unknown function (DUF4278)